MSLLANASSFVVFTSRRIQRKNQIHVATNELTRYDEVTIVAWCIRRTIGKTYSHKGKHS